MKLSTTLLAATISVVTSQTEVDLSPIRDKEIYDTLLDYVDFTEVTDIIEQNAPVTIIAPSNQAFGEVAGIIADSSTQEIQEILLNHIIPNATITSEVLKVAGCMIVETIGGLEVSMYRDPLSFKMDVDEDEIVDKDVFFPGGVLQGIEDVIIVGVQHDFLGCPEYSDLSAISDRDNFSTLLSVIKDSYNHWTITRNFDNTTIFGPTDAAFLGVKDTLDGLSESELDTLVRTHMANGELKSEEVISFGCVEVDSLAGTKLAVRYDEATETASVNGIPISPIDFDIVGEYFILHGIGGVLLPDQSQFVSCTEDELDFSPVQEAGNYGTLLELVVKSGMDATIGENRPTTILAPTDAAFARHQDTIDGLSDTELTAGLEMHIIGNFTVSSSLVVEQECIDTFTIDGSKISINRDPITGTTTVNGITVVETDIAGNYGMLHGLDGILGIDGEYSPCSPYDEIEMLAKFYEIDINAAADDRPITTFGPRNDAIFSSNIYPFEGEDSRQKEIDLILSHIVPGNFTVDVVKGFGCRVVETLARTKVRIMWDENGHGGHDHSTRTRNRRRLSGHMGSSQRGVVMVNDAKVILADQMPNEKNQNIFHGIDKLILPSSFSECQEPTMAPSPAPTRAPTPTRDPTGFSFPSSAVGFRLGMIFASMVALVTFS